MSAPSAEQLYEAFKLADKDGNGKLSVGELKELMLTLADNDEQKKSVDGMVDMLMEMCDQDGDKMLNYEELSQVISGQGPDKKQQMKMMFKMFDTDGSGNVSKKELCKAMGLNADETMQAVMEGLINMADKNNDGELNFEEFCSLMDSLDN